MTRYVCFDCGKTMGRHDNFTVHRYFVDGKFTNAVAQHENCEVPRFRPYCECGHDHMFHNKQDGCTFKAGEICKCAKYTPSKATEVGA